jgi:hypothetical protein
VSNSFLETVLPPQGRYCAVGIDDPSKTIRRHVFVDSIDELEDAAYNLNKQGFGAFFALSTFSADERKAEKSVELRSFFVDLDVGPPTLTKDGKVKEKPYREVPQAAAALKAFVRTTGLPTPTIVASGGGLHAYWAFTEAVPYETWKPAATAFKMLCLTNKLGIDAQVSADGARVLRMPGTDNLKLDEPRPVQVVLMGAQTPFEELLKLLPAVQVAVDLSAAKSYATVDDTTRALAQGDRKPAKFELILERKVCAQMTYCAENASILDEPMWRAGLSIAWNCTDAEAAIRRVSEGHEGYTPEATLEKAERLTGKPYTCSWFRENYPDRCIKCKQKVTSPIQLGTFVEEAPRNDDGEYEAEGDTSDENDPNSQHVKVKIPELPFPYFRAAAGGIYRKNANADGVELDPTLIYPLDLYVTNRFYDSDDNGDGEGELANIHLHTPHDGVRRFHAPVVSLLAKDKLRDVLVKHGVIAYGKQLDNIMAYIAESIRKLQSKFASNKTRSQMGWTPEGNFVVGDIEYTPSGPALAPPASGTRQLAPLFYSKGSIEGWRGIVDFYNRPGMEGHAFGFLVGLGSPLLKLLNSTQVRGAVVNLVSNGSGTGKTTVQMAINSVFGHPEELLMEAKDTPASRFHRLGTLNSICMTVDELTNATGEQLSALVYGSTSGRAPHRMEASSNKLRNNQTTWCSITVTSSNAVMADALASHRTAVEGELKRVIDFPITVPSHIPKAETDAHFAQLAQHFGVAGPVFIQHIVSNREAVEDALHQMQLRVDKEAGFERNDRFYSAVCTVAMVAGLIGNKLGLFNLDVKRIYAHAITKVGEVRDNNAVTVGTSKTMATELLSKFIAENVHSILMINSAKKGDAPAAPIVPLRGALKMRYEPDTDELVIPAADLREYFVSRRVDFKASVAEFNRMGALKANSKGELAVVRRLAAGAVGRLHAPSLRCYVFKTERLGMKIDPTAPDGADT